MKRTEPTSLLNANDAATNSDNKGDITMSISENDNKGLSTAVQKHIGNLLKVSYQDLLTDPVPDRFASLLEELEQAETKGK